MTDITKRMLMLEGRINKASSIITNCQKELIEVRKMLMGATLPQAPQPEQPTPEEVAPSGRIVGVPPPARIGTPQIDVTRASRMQLFQMIDDHKLAVKKFGSTEDIRIAIIGEMADNKAF